MPDFTPTPSQTLGPFYAYGLLSDADAALAGPAAKGARIQLRGRLLDKNGDPARDALIEIWQADAAGRYVGHDADADPDFKGFGRTLTRDDGAFRFDTVTPGPSAGSGNSLQAPHFAVAVFAGGLMKRVVTRIYVPDTELLASDAVLARLPSDARSALVAKPDGAAGLTFDIRLAGAGATPMFRD